MANTTLYDLADFFRLIISTSILVTEVFVLTRRNKFRLAQQASAAAVMVAAQYPGVAVGVHFLAHFAA